MYFVKSKRVFSKRYNKLDGLTLSDLDWMSKSRIGELGGKIVKVTQIRKLRGILKQKGIQLIVQGDKRNIIKSFVSSSDFQSFDDLLRFMYSSNPPKVGAFNARTKQFYLIKDATELVVFHEMAHLKHMEQIGEIAYLKLSRIDKEMYVWRQILANRYKWTEKELADSLKYINRLRKNEGLSIIKEK